MIPAPQRIILHEISRQLEVIFVEDPTQAVERSFRFSCEFLRVYSPSAEVRGHGPGQEVLVLDKQEVTIKQIEPIGQYGIKLIFSDGHDTGIYSWDYLYHLGTEQIELWQRYQTRVAQVKTTDKL